VPYKILNAAGDWIVQVQRHGQRRTMRGSGGERAARDAEAKLLAELQQEKRIVEAERLLGVEMVRSGAPKTVAQRPTLRAYFADRWVPHANVVQNATTRMKSEFPFKYLLFYLGDRRLDELCEPAVINEFVEKMKANGPLSFASRKDGQPWKTRCSELSNATINKCLQRLRALLHLAHAEKIIGEKPRIDLLPEDDTAPVVAPSEEQFKQLLRSCEDYREVAPLLPEVVEFAAATGLRVSEIFHLTFRSVDFARTCIRVETQRHTRMVNGRAWKPKHAKVREVPLSTRALEIVRQRHQEGPSAPNDPVFPSKGGAPYVRLEVSDDLEGKGFFRDAVEHAGLKGVVTFHGLRHLFAVRLLTKGVPIAVVSELLGHSDINLTVKRYGRFASDAKVRWEAVRVLD